MPGIPSSSAFNHPSSNQVCFFSNWRTEGPKVVFGNVNDIDTVLHQRFFGLQGSKSSWTS